MKTAIVTGANGFIGQAVCNALLEKGVIVWAVVRNKHSMAKYLNNRNIRICEAQLGNYSELANVLPRKSDVFYHFAWEGTSGAVLSDSFQQIKNIQYTCEALNLATEIECKKFILAGTINELEVMQIMYADKNPPRPACAYGIAKLTSDFLCKTIAAKGKIQFNCAIIGSCFGPGDKSKRIHNTFIQGMLAGKAPKLVNGDGMHDWIYIDDVAEMFYAIGEKSIPMKNYYLGHSKLRPFREILLEVRDILHPGLEIIFGEIEGEIQIDYSQIDINSVYEDTDYQCHTDFKECILKTAEWVKEYFGNEKF